jgi:hypothetical protein
MPVLLTCIEILRIKIPFRPMQTLCRLVDVASTSSGTAGVPPATRREARSVLFAPRAHCGRDARGPKRRKILAREDTVAKLPNLREVSSLVSGSS